MKVLVVYNTHRHGGGSDAVAKRTAELLTQAGHTVSVFTRSSKELSGLRGNLQAFFGGLYSPGAIRDFKQTLETFRPDVVHAHEVYPLITPWIFRVCKKRGVASVMTCHDYRLSCPVATHFKQGRLCFECVGGHEFSCIRYNCCNSRFKSLAYALRNRVARLFRLFSFVDLFLTPSEKAKEILSRYSGLSSDQVVAVGNPVAAAKRQESEVKDQMSDVRRQGSDYQSSIITHQSDGGYVAYAGRFEPEKGFDWLVEALAGTGILLKVAGDASGYLSFGRAVPGNVEFLGHLTREGIGQFYRNARLLVVPSLWDETFGLVVAEALSCGTPAVVTDLGALAEVAGPGGLVVPAGETAALRAAVCKLWNDKELCRSMAQAGQEYVKQFSDEAYLGNILSAYRNVLTRTRMH